MRNEGDTRTSVLRRVPGSVWLVMAILTASGLLAIWWLVDGDTALTVATGSQGASDTSTPDTVSNATPEIQLTGPSRAVRAPTAEAVIADPQCRMMVGQRTAADTALVYLPLGDGAWFAVVNTFGVVFDGKLPFIPERPRVGKRRDGTILVGFNLGDEVQVIHDGSVIYEFDDVWSFDIADDGSSLFVVEPLAGSASRLVIRNLELREEHHFDLGTTIAQTGRGLDVALAYSLDLAEVIVRPSGGRGGTSLFYPVVGGDPREVVVEHRPAMPSKDLSLFATSELSYHARNLNDEPQDRYGLLWQIVKVEREFGNGEDSREVWARDLQFLPTLAMQLSLDGFWLVLADPVAGIEVLHTADGEPVLSYPVRRDDRMQMMRYGSRFVNLAQRFRARFVGGELLVAQSVAGKPDEGWEVVAFELDPVAKRARIVRVFEVEPGIDETEQAFAIRTSLDPNAPASCKDHALLDRRLAVRDGRLVYWAPNY